MNSLRSKLLAAVLALGIPNFAQAEEPQRVFDEPTHVQVHEDSDVEAAAEKPDFEPRQDYHFTAVAGVDTPLLHFSDGYFAPLVKIQLYTELGNSPLDLLGTITTSESNLELMLRNPIANFSVAPFVKYIVQGDHLVYTAEGDREKDKEVSGSEFGGRLRLATDEEKIFSGSLTQEFAGKTYGWPAAPESGLFPDNHFVHRSILTGQLRKLEEDRALNLKDGTVLKLDAVYEFRPGFNSNVSGFENHEHTARFAGMFGLYFVKGFFDLQAEFRATGQFGADVYNAEEQGSMLSATAPGPGMFYKEHDYSQSVQGNVNFGFLIAGDYHIQPGFSVLVLPGTNSVEGGVQAEQLILPSATLRFDAKLGGVLPFGFRVGYSPLSPRQEDTLGGENSGSLEILAYVAVGFGKTSAE